MDGIYFSEQKPYENISLILRRHPFVLLGIILAFLITGTLPIAIYIGAHLNLNAYPAIEAFIKLPISLYYLVWLYSLFYELTDFFLDVWIVTDHRIIDIRQNGLFRRDESETRLSNIQDINVKINGLFPTFFNYGNVTIQTAGTEQEFEFQQIPDPIGVKDRILQLADQFKNTHIDGKEIHEYNDKLD